MKPIEAVRASTSKGGDRGGAATSTHHSLATTLNCLGVNFQIDVTICNQIDVVRFRGDYQTVV